MIRILCADISDADQNVYDSLYEKASPERRERADSYRRQEDRMRCVTADALLRSVLGTNNYRIEKSVFGKPYVKGRPDFFYNLSHSGRYVVIAWGDSEVGVDVQRHRDIDREAVAKRYFTGEEQTAVLENPKRFYEIWTAKESYVKYTGRGLHTDLRSFSVLTPESGIRYRYRILEGAYSLCLCSAEVADSFEMVNSVQLV